MNTPRGISETRWHREGRIAYDQGLPNSANPYPQGMNTPGRGQWFSGWYDEWRWQKWGANPGECYVPLHKEDTHGKDAGS